MLYVEVTVAVFYAATAVVVEVVATTAAVRYIRSKDTYSPTNIHNNRQVQFEEQELL